MSIALLLAFLRENSWILSRSRVRIMNLLFFSGKIPQGLCIPFRAIMNILDIIIILLANSGIPVR